MIPAIEMQQLFARTEELWVGATDLDDSQAELRDLFARARALAVEQLRDNEQLRVSNLLLERQKTEAEQRLEHNRLGKENEQLRAEIELLAARLADAERETVKYRRRYENVEQYNTALSNVYVASTQLHATLDLAEVVRTVGEVMWNLIAAPVYAIFVRDEKTGDFMLASGEGVEGMFAGGRMGQPPGLVADALECGGALFVEGAVRGDPLACVPLVMDDCGIVGLIIVYEIEARKEGFSELDRELFELLAGQTATAIISARAHGETVRKLKSVESFLSLIKPQ